MGTTNKMQWDSPIIHTRPIRSDMNFKGNSTKNDVSPKAVNWESLAKKKCGATLIININPRMPLTKCVHGQ